MEMEKEKRKGRRNTRAIGVAFERWCEKWLIENISGCMVHRQTTMAIPYIKDGKSMWLSRRQDILGCTDLICIHPLRPPMFIQATTHSGIGKKQADLLAVPWSVGCDIQVWQKKSPGRVVVWYLDHRTKSFCVIGEIHRGKWIDANEEMTNPCKLS